MPVYSVGFQSVGAAAGAAYASFQTTTARRAFIRQFTFFTNQPLQSAIGIGLAGNSAAVVQTGPFQPQPLDAADAACTTTAAATWTTAPTAPANFFFDFTLGPATGAGIIMPLARDEFVVLARSAVTTLAIWNFGAVAGSTLSVSITFEE